MSISNTLKDDLIRDRREIIREGLGNKGVRQINGILKENKGPFTYSNLVKDMYALGYFIDIFKNDETGNIIMFYSRYKMLNYSENNGEMAFSSIHSGINALYEQNRVLIEQKKDLDKKYSKIIKYLEEMKK